MQVILNEAVEKLGAGGEVVEVANGYARNYLIPRGLAVPADTKKVRQMGHQRKVIEDRPRAFLNGGCEGGMNPYEETKRQDIGDQSSKKELRRHSLFASPKVV